MVVQGPDTITVGLWGSHERVRGCVDGRDNWVGPAWIPNRRRCSQEAAARQIEEVNTIGSDYVQHEREDGGRQEGKGTGERDRRGRGRD